MVNFMGADGLLRRLTVTFDPSFTGCRASLTIGKDGSIQQTDVVEMSGGATLRDELTTLVNQIAPLPSLPDNADVLVVTTDLAFDYPGENLYDRYGRLSRLPG